MRFIVVTFPLKPGICRKGNNANITTYVTYSLGGNHKTFPRINISTKKNNKKVHVNKRDYDYIFV